VMLAASGTRSACPRRSCFRARRRGHRARVPCPNYQPSSGQLCMLDQNTRKSCSNGRKTLGKQLTGWQSWRQSAHHSVRVLTLDSFKRLINPKIEFRGRACVASAAVYDRPNVEI
jgi:hypothetical protein